MVDYEKQEIDLIKNKAKKAMFYRCQDGVLYSVTLRTERFFTIMRLNTYAMTTVYYDEVSVDAKFYVLKEI